MDSSIFIKTQGGNLYLYSMNKRMMRLVNPSFDKISKIVMNDYDIKDYRKKYKLKMDCNQIKYQLKKYEYLKKHGFFSEYNGNFKNRRLKLEDIEWLFHNLTCITFEMTESCNLNCDYCGYGDIYKNFYDERENKFMDFETAKVVIDYYLNMVQNNYKGRKKLVINFYGGEPLLNFDCIYKIVEYIKTNNYNRVIEFAMTTNGILLNKYMDFIAVNNFHLFVSLDGDNYNNSHRVNKKGINSFKIVYDNLKLLQKKHKRYFEERVNFNSVLNSRNSYESIQDFFYKEFNKSALVLELNSNNVRDKKKFDNMFRNGYESFCRYKESKCYSSHFKIGDPFFDAIIKLGREYFNIIKFKDYDDLFNEKLENYFSSSCLPFAKSIFITVNKKILYCEKVPHSKTLGSIDENYSISIDFNLILKKHNKIFDFLSKICPKCYMVNKCTSCLLTEESIEGCKEFKNKNQMASFLSILISYIEANRKDYIKYMEETTLS